MASRSESCKKRPLDEVVFIDSEEEGDSNEGDKKEGDGDSKGDGTEGDKEGDETVKGRTVAEIWQDMHFEQFYRCCKYLDVVPTFDYSIDRTSRTPTYACTAGVKSETHNFRRDMKGRGTSKKKAKADALYALIEVLDKNKILQKWPLLKHSLRPPVMKKSRKSKKNAFRTGPLVGKPTPEDVIVEAFSYIIKEMPTEKLDLL
eukprot:Platyproteum_vivax@DN16794_c0_g1_i1.p1